MKGCPRRKNASEGGTVTHSQTHKNTTVRTFCGAFETSVLSISCSFGDSVRCTRPRAGMNLPHHLAMAPAPDAGPPIVKVGGARGRRKSLDERAATRTRRHIVAKRESQKAHADEQSRMCWVSRSANHAPSSATVVHGLPASTGSWTEPSLPSLVRQRREFEGQSITFLHFLQSLRAALPVQVRVAANAHATTRHLRAAAAPRVLCFPQRRQQGRCRRAAIELQAGAG